MMIPLTTSTTAPVAPALVASALDCLALIPHGRRLEPALLIAVTRTVSGTEREAAALLVRIRAAAFVLCDPRWPAWSCYFRACTPEAHCAFDTVVLDLVAMLPLNRSLRFAPDEFFDALLGGVPVAIRN